MIEYFNPPPHPPPLHPTLVDDLYQIRQNLRQENMFYAGKKKKGRKREIERGRSGGLLELVVYRKKNQTNFDHRSRGTPEEG